MSYSPPKAFAEEMGLTRVQARELVISKKGFWKSNSPKSLSYASSKAFAEEMGLTRFQAGEVMFSEAGYWKHITSDIPPYLQTVNDGDLVLLDANICMEKYTDVVFQDIKGMKIYYEANLSEAEDKKRSSMLSVGPTDDRLLNFVALCGARTLGLSSNSYYGDIAVEEDHSFSGRDFLQRIKPLGYKLEKFWSKVPEKTFMGHIGYEGGVLFYNWDPGKQLNKFLETISWKPKRVFVLGARKEIEWYSDKLEIEGYSEKLESSLAFACFMRQTPFCVVK